MGPSAVQLDAPNWAIRVEAKSEAGLPSCSDRISGRCPSGAVGAEEILLPGMLMS
jgi:hypothetical protein